MAALERDRDALLRSYAEMTLEALDEITSEERHRIYRMLKLKVLVQPDGTLEASGESLGRWCFRNQAPAVPRWPKVPSETSCDARASKTKFVSTPLGRILTT